MHVGADKGRTDVIDAHALPRILDAITTRGYRIIDLRTLATSDAPPQGHSLDKRHARPKIPGGKLSTAARPAAATPGWA